MTNEEAIDVLKLIRYHGTERLIKALDVAISALESQRWIPVTERLPEMFEDVLVCLKGGKVNRTWYDDSGHFRSATSKKVAYYKNVTHWMPLPQPPKEEN